MYEIIESRQLESKFQEPGSRVSQTCKDRHGSAGLLSHGRHCKYKYGVPQSEKKCLNADKVYLYE